jgi:hypothetical protein
MLTADQIDKKITTQTSENLPDFLLDDRHDAHYSNGFHDQGVLPRLTSDSAIFTIPSQIHQGLDWVREAALEIKKNLTRSSISFETNNQCKAADPQAEEAAVPLVELMTRHEQIPKYAAVLGYAEDCSTILHDFESRESPHLLIVGGADAGKTVMLRSIASSLALNNRQSEIQLAAISPIAAEDDRRRRQAEEWYALNYLPHMLCDIAFKHSDILELLTFLNNEIAYREEHTFKYPHLIVLIDQVDVLIDRGGRRCAEPILRLAQKGEDVGIHLVLTAQSLDSQGLSTHLLKEIPTRLIGRPSITTPTQNHQLMRDDDVEQLLGEGDFIFKQNGRSLRMQGAYIGNQELLPKLIEMNRHRAILLAEPVESRLRLKESGQKSRIKWPSKVVDQVPVETS